MPDHQHIYLHEADTYHLMISKQPKLASYIADIRPYDGLDIVDMGAGTGRITLELAPKARSIIALDASEAMLQVTSDQLRRIGLTNWTTRTADHRSLPLPDNSADLIISGWSICYLTNDNIPEREVNLQRIMSEIHRVLRSDGTAIIIETMGTGEEQPNPPLFLHDYYEKLTEMYGFTQSIIRHDYLFDNPQQAETTVRFFFGDELAERVALRNSPRVSEFAGIWRLQL